MSPINPILQAQEAAEAKAKEQLAAASAGGGDTPKPDASPAAGGDGLTEADAKALEALQAQIADLQAQLVVAQEDAGAPRPPSDHTDTIEAWPSKGYNGPQPWEVSDPPPLTQSHGLIASGTAGQEVAELGGMLCELGYANDIGEGTNPHAIFRQSLLAAVNAFRADYGIKEDPALIAQVLPSVVGPWTWEAIHRALRDHEIESAGA